ncbi:hypothetical protein DH2020_029168 [Rehmannia glutinosa]|uniref:Retrotransposon Copia-like N-terminal domain-containing protein n=1 Tax=Rehmannia glutinosa TaxID=99300 RepID=A0ABR0VT19_REHGL
MGMVPVMPREIGALTTEDDTGKMTTSTYTRDLDPLALHGSDHPGMVLVTNPLNGSNYLYWRRAMRLALGAKSKLGFIYGTVHVPELDTETYAQFQKVNFMVISWLLNAISKDIVEAFMCVKSSKQLWDELAERYRESNGPLRYQLRKEISNFTQGTSLVTTYFSKLKCLWDEYACIVQLPECTCGAGRAICANDMDIKLLQFVMGLNENVEPVKNQILLMDPLPTVNKAYSMILKVEKQKAVHNRVLDPLDTTAMLAKEGFNQGSSGHGAGFGRGGNRNVSGTHVYGRGRGQPRKSKEEKAKLLCEHCGYSGHEIKECFKLHGYPDWYKKTQGAKSWTIN